MLRWGGQNPWWTVHALILLNQYSFWSITCCKAISPVAKFNHVLGRGFMIQQEILILSQSEWTILHGTIILTIISFSDKVLLVYYLFEMKNYIQCKVNVNDNTKSWYPQYLFCLFEMQMFDNILNKSIKYFNQYFFSFQQHFFINIRNLQAGRLFWIFCVSHLIILN